MAEVSKVPSIFACPHCMQAFTSTTSGVVCPNGHSFDRAREGYLNLLVGGRIAGDTVPGDTPASLAARRRFLSTSAYAPIADALATVVSQIDGPVLDVGCGEGYYLSHINSPYRYGIDIADCPFSMDHVTLSSVSLHHTHTKNFNECLQRADNGSQ